MSHQSNSSEKVQVNTTTPWTAQEIDPNDKEWGACEIWAGNDLVASHVCGVENARLIVRAVNNHDALVAALRPFANYACDPPCNCHNCAARTAIQRATT